MELVKNIFFNTDRLTANSTVKISYTGKFFQDESKEVSIRYGFGEDWKNAGNLDYVSNTSAISFFCSFVCSFFPTNGGLPMI